MIGFVGEPIIEVEVGAGAGVGLTIGGGGPRSVTAYIEGARYGRPRAGAGGSTMGRTSPLVGVTGAETTVIFSVETTDIVRGPLEKNEGDITVKRYDLINDRGAHRNTTTDLFLDWGDESSAEDFWTSRGLAARNGH